MTQRENISTWNQSISHEHMNNMLILLLWYSEIELESQKGIEGFGKDL